LSKHNNHLTKVIFEHIRIGQSVKVSAVDPNTGTEVSIIGPASASPRILEENARKKLLRRLEKNKKIMANNFDRLYTNQE